MEHLMASFEKIPTTKSIDDIEGFDARFEEHARRFAATLGIPSDDRHVPFDRLKKSIDRTVKNSISKPSDINPSSPFVDTDLVIFVDNYNGEVPLNGIKRSDFNVLEAFYGRLISNQTIIKVEGSHSFRTDLMKIFRDILSNEVGREFLYRLCKETTKKLIIKAVTPTFPTNCTIPNENYNEVTIYMSFEEVQVTSRTKKGLLYPTQAPQDTILFHEMIHALHMFTTPSDADFKQKLLSMPKYGHDYENCEEECTIGYVPPGSKVTKDWKHRSITENDLRISRNLKLPARYGHHGTSKPPAVLDIKDPETQYYFFQACSAGYVDAIKNLLMAGMPPDTVYSPEEKSTPLMAAAKNGRLNVVLLLLEHGAKTNIVTRDHLTFTHYCVMANNISMMIFLKQHNILNIEQADQGPNPLISFAIKKLKNRCGDMIDFLLKNKAQITRESAGGSNAIFDAAESVTSLYLFTKIFIKFSQSRNFSLFQPNHEGITPMHLAFAAGNTDLIKTFFTIEHTYHIVDGRNWMHFAAESGSRETVEYLLSISPVYFLNDPNDVMMDFVLQCNAEDLNQKRNFITFFLSLGFKLQKVHTPLYVSTFVTASPNVRDVVLLRSYMLADIDDPICHERTLLSWAVSEGDLELANFALTRGAKVNPDVSEQQQETPLHLAILRNDRELVELLLYWSADKFKKNYSGETPLEMVMNRLNSDKTFDPDIYLALNFDLESEIKRISKASKIAFTPSLEEIFANFSDAPSKQLPSPPSPINLPPASPKVLQPLSPIYMPPLSPNIPTLSPTYIPPLTPTDSSPSTELG